MQNQINWSKLRPPLRTGVFDVAIPVGALGTKKRPRVAITALIHGDEPTGSLILYRLVQEQLLQAKFHGTLHILPVLNPLAAVLNRRVGIDSLDANRVSQGNEAGQITEQIIAVASKFLAKCDLVINLHEFETDSLLTCIYANAGDAITNTKILRSILAFNPPTIWSIPKEPSDGFAVPSFDRALAIQRVPVFSVELSRKDLATNKIQQECIDALMRVLQNMHIVELPQANLKVSIPSYPFTYHKREAAYSTELGIWQPNVALGSPVEKNQLIGELIEASSWQKKAYNANKSGTLVQIRPPEFTYPNNILYAIGEQDEGLQTYLQSLSK